MKKNRLKELIEEKYGIGKFVFGCEMVARFLSFDLKQKIKPKNVQKIVEHKAHTNLLQEEEEALRSLFKLKTVEELFQEEIEEEQTGAALIEPKTKQHEQSRS